MVQRDSKGRFVKGMTTWNKGKETSLKTRMKQRMLKLKDGSITVRGYKMLKKLGKHIFFHHDVWLRESEWRFIPEGFVVHHINQNKLDNRIENLACIPRGDHTYLHRFKGGTETGLH